MDEEISPTGGPVAVRRLDGVDVARGLAILGMLTRHIGPNPQDPAVASGLWWWSRTDGRASVLFVVVAGVGVALLARRRPTRQVRARLLYRTLWLVPLGLWLQGLDHPVAVILAHYGAFFLALAPFVRCRDRTLLVAAAATAVAGSAAVLAARVLAPHLTAPVGGTPPGVVSELVLFGTYPVVTYLPPMLFGLWLGRRDLTDRATRWAMVTGGAAALVTVTAASLVLPSLTGVTPEPTSWSWVLAVDGHAEMPLALIGATGTATAVLGLSLLVAGAVPRATWPLTAFGRVALTVYVGHLLAFPLLPGQLRASTLADGVATVATIAVVATLGAVAWLSVLPRGPLEAAVRWPYQRFVAPRVGAARTTCGDGRASR